METRGVSDVGETVQAANLSTFRTLPGHAYDVLHSSMAECHWIVDSGVMLPLEVVVVQQAKRLHERSVRFHLMRSGALSR